MQVVYKIGCKRISEICIYHKTKHSLNQPVVPTGCRCNILGSALNRFLFLFIWSCGVFLLGEVCGGRLWFFPCFGLGFFQPLYAPPEQISSISRSMLLWAYSRPFTKCTELSSMTVLVIVLNHLAHSQNILQEI